MSNTQARRDVRVDRIGLVDEVVRQFRAPLAEQVKADMGEGDRVSGDLFGALLVCGIATDVDPEKFFKAFEAGKMTRAQFLSAIKVSTSRAREILSEKDLARISETRPTSPALRVSRLDGVQVELVDAIREISAAVLTPPRPGKAA